MKRDQDHGFFEEAESSALRIVLQAVGLLLLILFAASLHLTCGPLTPVRLSEPQELAEVAVVFREYHGPLWGMEAARRKLKQELEAAWAKPREVITQFPNSPAHLRMIAVDAKVGYIVPAGAPADRVPGYELIRPGVRLRAWVKGGGDGTATAAFRSAGRHLLKDRLQPQDAVRYEIKTVIQDQPVVEHWIGLTPK